MKIIRRKTKSSLAKAFAEPLDLEQEGVYRKLTIVEELLQFMKREGINRSELAKRMDVLPSRITKMLSGDSNLTIDTLVRAGRAVGADLAQTFVPKGHRIEWLHYASQKAGHKSIRLEPKTSIKPVKQALSPKLSNPKPAEHDAEDAA